MNITTLNTTENIIYTILHTHLPTDIINNVSQYYYYDKLHIPLRLYKNVSVQRLNKYSNPYNNLLQLNKPPYSAWGTFIGIVRGDFRELIYKIVGQTLYHESTNPNIITKTVGMSLIYTVRQIRLIKVFIDDSIKYMYIVTSYLKNPHGKVIHAVRQVFSDLTDYFGVSQISSHGIINTETHNELFDRDMLPEDIAKSSNFMPYIYKKYTFDTYCKNDDLQLLEFPMY